MLRRPPYPASLHPNRHRAERELRRQRVIGRTLSRRGLGSQIQGETGRQLEKRTKNRRLRQTPSGASHCSGRRSRVPVCFLPGSAPTAYFEAKGYPSPGAGAGAPCRGSIRHEGSQDPGRWRSAGHRSASSWVNSTLASLETRLRGALSRRPGWLGGTLRGPWKNQAGNDDPMNTAHPLARPRGWSSEGRRTWRSPRRSTSARGRG